VIQVESLERLETELSQAREDVLVMLTQPSWCVPCRRLRPHVEKLNESGLSVLYVDLDRVPEAAEHYGVLGVPHLYFYPEDQDAVELAGRTVVQLQREIEEIRAA
jgi:thiol-disulfide isomerase/thioredoxin